MLNKTFLNNNDEIYCWLCDDNPNHGEGILGKSFLKFIKNSSNCRIKIITAKKFFIFKDEINYSNIYKYLSPLIGILILWFYFLKGKKVCYVNFLPLWNSFLFLFLPPKTILGPITGYIYKGKIQSILDFVRYYIFPFIFKINLFFLKFRNKVNLFATDKLKKIISNNLDNNIFNFTLYSFKKKRDSNKKKFDFIIYYRKYETKQNKFIISMIRNLNLYNYTIAVVGHKIKIKGVCNFGFISRKKIDHLMSQSVNTILSGENLMSFFCLDAVANNIRIFYNNKNFLDKNIFLDKETFISLCYNDERKSFKDIIFSLKKIRRYKIDLISKEINHLNTYKNEIQNKLK